MIADPNRYSGGPIVKSGPTIMDEIPRTYEPDFRTLPHYPEGRTRPGLPGIFDDFPGMPSGLPGRRKQTYEECQRNQDPNVMYFADPCRGLPHGGFKLPDIDPPFERYPRTPGKLPNIDPDFARYGPGAMTGTLPSVGQELGKLAGYFLGNYIKDRLG